MCLLCMRKKVAFDFGRKQKMGEFLFFSFSLIFVGLSFNFRFGTACEFLVPLTCRMKFWTPCWVKNGTFCPTALQNSRTDDYLITQVRFSEVPSYMATMIKMHTYGIFGKFRHDANYRALVVHNTISHRNSATLFDN